MIPDASTPRLVVTLGPSTEGIEVELVEAGAGAFRLNASHFEESGLTRALERLGRIAPTTPVIVDLQGAKMRLGEFEPLELRAGDVLAIVLSDTAVGRAVPLPHPEAFSALRIGDAISLDDSKLHATVVRVGSTTLELIVHDDGVVRPRKGFNRADHPVHLDRLTARDTALARRAIALDCGSLAFSFTTDGRECAWLRELDARIRVIAKIERADALANLQQIASRADVLWICRGDLGAQVGELELGHHVAAIDPQQVRCPTFMAGQVLEHLTEHASPTRSELCHVVDLGAKGYAGIVLSDETAIGRDPVGATRWAAQLVARAFR